MGLIAGFAAGPMALIGLTAGAALLLAPRAKPSHLAHSWGARLGDHPEPERWKHLRVDQRMLHGLQIVPGQYPGEIGAAGLM